MKKYLLKKFASRFIRSGKGSVTVEAVLIFVGLSVPVFFITLQFFQLVLANIYTQGNAFFAARSYTVARGNTRIQENNNINRTKLLTAMNLLPMLPAKIMLPYSDVAVEKTADADYMKITTISFIHFDPFGTFSPGGSTFEDGRVFTVGSKIAEYVKRYMRDGAEKIGDKVGDMSDYVLDQADTILGDSIKNGINSAINGATASGIPVGKLINLAMKAIGQGDLGQVIGNYVVNPMAGKLMDQIKPVARDYLKSAVVNALVNSVGGYVQQNVDALLAPLFRNIGVPNHFMYMYGYACMLPPRHTFEYGY